MAAATNTEHFLALKTAKEYRSKGYEVTLEAPLDFLPGYRADLIVRKDGEAKVIEVKSRSSLAASPQIRELAQTLEAKPGWSFELLLVAQPECLASPEGSRPLDSGDIRQRIEEAETVLASGHPEAALLLAWSACEATIRMLLAEQGVSNPDVSTARYIFDQATYLGVISREEYRCLTHVEKYRNAIAHGYNLNDFGDDLVIDLLAQVRRFIAENDC